MKARLSENLPTSNEWVYEIKFDGFRGLALKNGTEVRLISRNHRELGPKFPGVIAAIRNLPCNQLLLDGELVALDEKGRSSFQLLQGGGNVSSESAGLFFYVFDILNVNGHETTGLPLLKRKALLQTLIKRKSKCIRYSDVLTGDIEELSQVMRSMGLEGLIAKKRDSLYEVGARSGSWIKFKWANEQEFVIGGYTDPEGSRPYFGSVLVGYYDGPKLHFVAKVGTGFNVKLLKSLYDQFQKMRLETTSFANLPERGGVIGPSQMRFCKWIEPTLVCQVRFTEWTRDGHLRQPVFLGVREDKDPRQVVKEIPAQN
ncbi:MAG TPA: non-homologous end-joining DNA ligase [Candidatus Kapabacteria bacterium]|nr:non-homologous end-joining DNA ligase [Candidatus Kapabacteria bacterium]